MVEFVTEMGSRYVKIPFFQDDGQNAIMAEYEYTMLENTNIPGIAKTSKQIVEGKTILLYSISSYISLEERIKKGNLTKEIFCDFFKQLMRVYENIQMYLLDGDALNLDPAYIFYDEISNKYIFLVGTVEKSIISEKLEKLLTFFADICPIEQQELLELIFEFFGRLSEDNFEVRTFINHIVQYKFEEPKNEEKIEEVVCEENAVSNIELQEEFEKKKSISIYILCMTFLVLAVYFGFFVECEFKYCVVSMTLVLLATGFMAFQVIKIIGHKMKS